MMLPVPVVNECTLLPPGSVVRFPPAAGNTINLPAAQSEHDVAPAVTADTQMSQAVVPGVAEYVPAEHDTHEVAAE
ncbi:hypothetical protein JZU54_05475 [bacterium]|nr:hypothetical protein [bacterium]